MKVLLKNLIPDKYYYCYDNLVNTKYYFKYKYHDKYNIYCYNFKLDVNDEKIVYDEKIDHRFCGILFHDMCIVFKEIDVKEIVDYLPEDNIDKKIYIRQQKIKSLLNV